MRSKSSLRFVVVWCPDWPAVVTADERALSMQTPVAVADAGRVVSANFPARQAGVRPGLRVREAQAHCSTLVVMPAGGDVTAFEPVLAAIQTVAANVMVVRPGTAAVPASAARYHGGEAILAERLVDAVAAAGAECYVGIADGLLAASLAARTATIVPPGDSAQYLAGFGVDVLPGLDASLLRRLGITTIGQFAALPQADVINRFGRSAQVWHAAAGACGGPSHVPRTPPPDLRVVQRFDSPLRMAGHVAAAALQLATDFTELLLRHQLGCEQIRIHARTPRGEEQARIWHYDPGFTPIQIADRVRWQLETWSFDAGVSELAIVPVGEVAAGRWQTALTGEQTAADELAANTASRLRSRLGAAGVGTVVLRCGRGVADAVEWVPWGSERAAAATTSQPWPGRLPPPWPTTVFPQPQPAIVLDAQNVPLKVTGRYELTGVPFHVIFAGRRLAVREWAGPWPVEERWWAGEPRRLARMQVTTAESPLLLALRLGSWYVEGEYG